MNDTAKSIPLIIKLILIALIIIFILIISEDTIHAFNIDSFIENKFTEILFFLSIGIMLRKYFSESWHFLGDAIVVASTIGLMIEVQHIRDEHNKLNVEGEWIYEVRNDDGLITHGGTSIIKQFDDGSLQIDGFRKYECKKTPYTIGCKAGEQLIKTEDMLWTTKPHFAVVHGDKTKFIYFVYTIQAHGNELGAYCWLTPTTKDKKPTILRGEYTSLASVKIEEVARRIRGSILFYRTKDESATEALNRKIEENNSHKQETP